MIKHDHLASVVLRPYHPITISGPNSVTASPYQSRPTEESQHCCWCPSLACGLGVYPSLDLGHSGE